MMKVILVIFSIILVIFIAVQLYAAKSQSNIEGYPYVVDKKYDAFEIRSHEASLFTSVKLSTNEYKEGSSKGFSILAGYIFGGNETKEQIAMTSPVSMSLDDTMTMMFMVPKKFDKNSLPKPDQSQVEFREEPAKTMAAITFGGWSDDAKIDKYKKKLITALESEGISYTKKFHFLGYNAPFEVFNRKNEVVVELEKR
jgi:hypothetical protein